MSSRKRSVLKSITWRITASLTTILIVWAVSGELIIAGEVALLEVFIKMLVYYFHERAWDRVPAGDVTCDS